jgi:hypothetical protein
MEKILNNRLSPVLLGFYQALGVVLYTVLIGVFFNLMQRAKTHPPDLVAAPVILTLFVLSAAITGTLVFGLPAYYAFTKNNINRAISTLVYTFVFIFLAVFVSGLAILLIYKS